MANIKFSAFDATDPVSATIDLVAAKSGNNIRFTPADLAPFTGIYAANGTIGTTRKALITDTIQFRNAGDTSDIFSLNTDGTFTLGLGAVSSSEDNVVIGKDATDRDAANTGNVIIGKGANLANTAGTEIVNVLIGQDAFVDGSYSACIGNSVTSTGSFNVALGSSVNLVSNYSMGFGRLAKSTADNSITFNALSNQINTTNTVDNSFKVFMSSQTTPDLDIVGGGESTLNTSLKITGQAYTELHTGATPADPDWNNGNIQEMTLASSDQDFDPSNAKAGATYILKIKQPSSGAAGTINWNAASATVLWPSPGEPTLSTANNAVDIVTLICVVGGVSGGTYYANATLNFS